MDLGSFPEERVGASVVGRDEVIDAVANGAR